MSGRTTRSESSAPDWLTPTRRCICERQSVHCIAATVLCISFPSLRLRQLLQFFPIPPAPPRIASALAVLPSPATAASSARSAPNSSRPCSRATPPPPASSSPSARASPTWPSPPSPLPRCAAGAAACFVDAHSLLASCSCCLLDDAAWGEAGTGRRRGSLVRGRRERGPEPGVGKKQWPAKGRRPEQLEALTPEQKKAGPGATLPIGATPPVHALISPEVAVAACGSATPACFAAGHHVLPGVGEDGVGQIPAVLLRLRLASLRRGLLAAAPRRGRRG